MGRYFYPSAPDALSAKKMFLREHGYKISHCFQNTWGAGYVLFDTKADVNAWYKEHTGDYFYKEEYEPGTIYTKADAIKEIERSYGSQIEEVLRFRNPDMPVLALGLPSQTAFGNRMFLQFVKSADEDDIERRFYLHYEGVILDATSNISNSILREQLYKILYKYYYNTRFKKRIEGSNEELARREAVRRAEIAERERKERERQLEQQRREEEIRRRQREEQAQRERDIRYREALRKYEVDKAQYEREMVVYNQAMALKKSFTHGGQFPNGAWFICFLLLLCVIFASMFLSSLEDTIPYTLLILLDIVFLIGGYRIIFKKLKPYLEEEHFDEKGFQEWMSAHPNSPLIRYVRNSWQPQKPTPPVR